MLAGQYTKGSTSTDYSLMPSEKASGFAAKAAPTILWNSRGN